MSSNFFHGKTIAVIGNSEKLLEQSYGDLIDSHDIVIRFNRAWPNKARKRSATGSKTTHMSLVLRDGYEAMIARNPKICFFLPLPPMIKNVPKACQGLPRIGGHIISMCKADLDLTKRPSSGLSVLWFLLNMTAASKVSIFGMDGMKSNKWYEKKGHWKGHDKEREQSWLQEIREFEIVEFYEV